MPRFTAAQFAAAVAAGAPRASAEFFDDEEWHAYQDSWMAVFSPIDKLAAPEDKARRLQWKAATRQFKKIEAAREASAALFVTLVPAPRREGEESLTAVVANPARTSAAAAAAATAALQSIAGTSAAAATSEGAAAFTASAIAAAALPTPSSPTASPNKDEALPCPTFIPKGPGPPGPPDYPPDQLAHAAAIGAPPSRELGREIFLYEADYQAAQHRWLQAFYGVDDVVIGDWDHAVDHHLAMTQQLHHDAWAANFNSVVAANVATAASDIADKAASMLSRCMANMAVRSAAAETSPEARQIGDTSIDDMAEDAERVALAAVAADTAADVAADVAAVSTAAAMAVALPAGDCYILSRRLQVSDVWMRRHVPIIDTLELATPHLTPTQQHAERRLRAHGVGPGGEPLVASDVVRYSLPPSNGESHSEKRRRGDRHLKREQDALHRLGRRLEFEYSDVEKARDHAARMEHLRAQVAKLKAEAVAAKAAAIERETMERQQLEQSVEQLRAEAKLYKTKLTKMEQDVCKQLDSQEAQLRVLELRRQLRKFRSMKPPEPSILAAELRLAGHQLKPSDFMQGGLCYSDYREPGIEQLYIQHLMPPSDTWPAEFPQIWTEALTIVQYGRGYARGIANVDLQHHSQYKWKVSIPEDGVYRASELPLRNSDMTGGHGLMWALEQKSIDECPDLHETLNGSPGVHHAEAAAQLRARGDYCEHDRPRWRFCKQCRDTLVNQAVTLHASPDDLVRWLDQQYSEIAWANDYISPFRVGVRQRFRQYVPETYR